MIVQFLGSAYDSAKDRNTTVNMFMWIRKFIEADRHTKLFILNWLTYGLALIVTTVYCYGRLDQVRSYKKTPQSAQVQQTLKQP